MSNEDGYFGTAGPSDRSSDYNTHAFMVRQIMNGRHHVEVVRVVRVTSSGDIAVAGTVDVLPMVNQLDGQGNAVAHTVIGGLPYYRIQAGGNAIVMDPQVDDIGLILIADRDISALKASRDISNPGSQRRCSWPDGIYLGGILNGAPTQWIQFHAGGIAIHSPDKITLDAPIIEMTAGTKITATAPVIEASASSSITFNTSIFTVNGAAHITGPVTSDASVTAPTVSGTVDVVFAGKSGAHHTHGNVSNGPDHTGGPD